MDKDRETVITPPPSSHSHIFNGNGINVVLKVKLGVPRMTMQVQVNVANIGQHRRSQILNRLMSGARVS